MTDLQHLEPGEDNPLDLEYYSPYHHTYYMLTDTDYGLVELGVQFTVATIDEDHPDQLIYKVGEEYRRSPASQANIWPNLSDTNEYVIPIIVRARTIPRYEEWVPGSDAYGARIPEDQVRGLITDDHLLWTIRQYHRSVQKDPQVPVALLDLLYHFEDEREQEYQDYDDVDMEW